MSAFEEPAAGLREQGNAAFKGNNFEEAVRLYTAALEATDLESEAATGAKIYGNRSAAKLSLGDAEAALADAECAIELDETWAKGYFRKAAALAAVERHFAAKRAYEAALECAPMRASERTWFERKALESRKACMKRSRTGAVEDADAFMDIYRDERDPRMKLCTLAHYWNIMEKEQRWRTFLRFLQIMAGPADGDETVAPPDGLTAERMTLLPMDNYVDVERVQVWMDFFEGLDTDGRLALLERIWNALAVVEQTLVIKDLKFFLLKPLLEERAAALQPGGIQIEEVDGDEEEKPEDES